ncbi:MAG: Re/Si-specific NAD(P)(+) transhydrogenase subunit alpha [Candidatus Polarisedimenticolia bacterium]
MKVGVVKETYPGERRVALTPAVIPMLKKAGLEVLVQASAGEEAGYPDAAYRDQGATLAASRDEVFAAAGILTVVRGLGYNPRSGHSDLEKMRSGQLLIGFLDPLTHPDLAREAAARGIVALSMEMIPRITRAQSMDALSSMATVSGYKAVLLAAATLPRMFPMLMTAAGTLAPSRVLVIGAGVAGLQAIATARRLGAVVEAYDVRPAVKEQVQSLGARFVEMPLETGTAEGTGGYARQMGVEFYRKQRELMATVVARNDVVVSTAAVPGKRAPVLVTRDMVRGMAPGSLIVDLAAERGGNCEVTRPDETVVEHGVTVLGPTNLPATVPFHSSQLYARNVANLLVHLVKGGTLTLDPDDEITRDTTVTRGGEVTHPAVRSLLGAAEAVPGRSS